MIPPKRGEGYSLPLSLRSKGSAAMIVLALVLSLVLLAMKRGAVFSLWDALLTVMLSLAGVLGLHILVYCKRERAFQRIKDGVRQIAFNHHLTGITPGDRGEPDQLASDIVYLGREISDQHLELKKQLEMYQGIFEGAPCIITIQDREDRLIKFNKYFAEHFRAIEGVHCFEAYKNQTWKCDSCPVEETFRDGRSHSSEESGFYSDGTRAHWIVSTSPLYDSMGHVVAAISISLDITARKKLEEELKKSERKYYEIFNHIPYAIFLLDSMNLQVIDCNKTATLLYGYTKGELIGKQFIELFSESEKDYPQLLRSKKKMSRVKHNKKGGKNIYVNIYLSHPEYQVGQKLLLATVVDITERIESEQQLIQANKMATLGEMATGVAHELNQPLTAIQLAAGLFARSVENGRMPEWDTLRTVADKLQVNLDRSSKIISHMREFGRKSKSSAEPMQLNDVIIKSMDFFYQQLQLREIDVLLELEENLPLIKGDPNRLEQVFINLLMNARDAIEEKLERFPALRQRNRIIMKTRAKRRVVLAEVTDTGTGISRDMVQKIFEPFFTTKQVGKGTGLGLSICYGIVSDYGGTIHAYTREGEGASFRMRFPRADVVGKRFGHSEGMAPPLMGR